jgi:hypothetical protein
MDQTGFAPVSAAIGGALIGLAAVLLMALNGRIAGVSGIVAGILGPMRKEAGGDLSWRIAFVAGLIASPLLLALFTGAKAVTVAPHPLWAMALGGLLVGYGTRLGSGCTSGHGVCGVARLSKRSIAATATFMATAIATVFILHHIIRI